MTGCGNVRVSTESFEDGGRISFELRVSGCTDSSGRFEYSYRVQDESGTIRQYNRRTTWARSFGEDSVRVDDDVMLADGLSLLSVNPIQSSVECYCYISDHASLEHSSGKLLYGPIVDPDTIASVKTVFSKTDAYNRRNYRIEQVDALAFQWGEAKLDIASAKTLPNKFEQRILRIVNCDPSQKKNYNRHITVETTRSVSVEMTNTVTFEQETKIGLNLSIEDIAGINADIITKNTISLSRRDTQSFSERVTDSIDIDLSVDPMTDYLYKYTAVKGLLSVPIKGRMIIDAQIFMRRTDIPALAGTFWLSDPKLLPDPQQRMVEFSGTLVNETYERVDISHSAKPIGSIDDPVCQAARDGGSPLIAELFSTFVGNG